MSNVISIAGNIHIPGEPCSEVVDILQSLLTDAMAGNLQTLFVTGRTSSGAIIAAYEFQDSPIEIANALANLKRNPQDFVEPNWGSVGDMSRYLQALKELSEAMGLEIVL